MVGLCSKLSFWLLLVLLEKRHWGMLFMHNFLMLSTCSALYTWRIVKSNYVIWEFMWILVKALLLIFLGSSKVHINCVVWLILKQKHVPRIDLVLHPHSYLVLCNLSQSMAYTDGPYNYTKSHWIISTEFLTVPTHLPLIHNKLDI